MAKKSKGVNRLSILIGVLSAAALFVVLYDDTHGFMRVEGSDWFRIIFYMLLAYSIGWGLVKAIYWVYCGFKEDREGK